MKFRTEIEILPYDRSRLHLGAFRIEEPDGDDTVDISDIDLIIVPGVAYDRHGNRVGRGKGYYLWHDRARHVVSVDLNVRPIKPLSVDVSWRLRAQRSIVTPVWFETPEGVTADEYTVNLRNSSDLSARAVWTFSPALDVSLSATNILGRGCYQLDTTPMRSVAILAGATYKF